MVRLAVFASTIGVGIFLLGCGNAREPKREPIYPVTITFGEPKVADSAVALPVQLSYDRGKPLQVHEADLPWGNTYSVKFTLRENGSAGPVVPESPVIDDLSPTVLTLDGGDTLAGVVDLRNLYPKLLDILERVAVSVEWEYGLISLAGDTVCSQRGSLIVRR